MMFSRRTGWDRKENPWSKAMERARAMHGTLVDLTESNPTRAGLGAPPSLLAELGHPRGAFYEPEAFGHREAREAVAAYYLERGTTVGVDDIVLSASTSESYGWLFKLLCDAGDAVLVPTPGYPLFSYLAEMEGVTLEPYRMELVEGVYRLDQDGLKLQVTPRTKALVLVHPNNPTGSFVHPDDRRFVEALAAQHGLALIVDEVFGDYAFDDALRRRPPSFAGESSVLTFVLSGLSKVMALPQVKLGWMVVSGPPDDKAEALARLELVADSYLSVGTPVQRALPALLAQRKAVQDALGQRVRRNLEGVRQSVASCGGIVRLLPVEAGWYAVLQQDRWSDEEWAMRVLLGDGVLVHPGYFFDYADEGVVVVSLLASTDALTQGLESLCRHACP